MRSVVTTLLVCLAASLGAASVPGNAPAAAPEQVELKAEATASGGWITLGELSAHELDPAWASLALRASPQAGERFVLSQKLIRRLLSQVAPGPLPRLTGATQTLVRRPGHRLEAGRLEEQLLFALNALPVPEGASGQRFTVIGALDRMVGSAGGQLRIVSKPPMVGRGNVRVELADGAGNRERFHVSILRELSCVAQHSSAPLRAGKVIASADVEARPVWIDNRGTWEQLCRGIDEVVGATAVRALSSGSLLRRKDVRPTPVVRRGAPVHWVIDRGGIQVRLATVARGDAAVGDWVWVESPFARRLTRVMVLGPGLVGNTKAKAPRGEKSRGDHR